MHVNTQLLYSLPRYEREESILQRLVAFFVRGVCDLKAPREYLKGEEPSYRFTSSRRRPCTHISPNRRTGVGAGELSYTIITVTGRIRMCSTFEQMSSEGNEVKRYIARRYRAYVLVLPFCRIDGADVCCSAPRRRGVYAP